MLVPEPSGESEHKNQNHRFATARGRIRHVRMIVKFGKLRLILKPYFSYKRFLLGNGSLIDAARWVTSKSNFNSNKTTGIRLSMLSQILETVKGYSPLNNY